MFPPTRAPDLRTEHEGDSMYSLAQAAKATGKSKPTIARAIKAGRLSATRGEGGNYLIDESELARVYPLAGDGTGTMKQLVPPNGAGTSPATLPGEVEGLRLLLAEREGTIRDLRARLDGETEERRREAEERRRLLALLADQRVRPWWRRWFR
jgi:excisionase family DNA binding protein